MKIYIIYFAMLFGLPACLYLVYFLEGLYIKKQDKKLWY